QGTQGQGRRVEQVAQRRVAGLASSGEFAEQAMKSKVRQREAKKYESSEGNPRNCMVLSPTTGIGTSPRRLT
ncbi:MAG: hypothetical protein VB835_17915, partial [Pirellulales bacterium]